jgi:hypothetical protein
VPDEGSVDISHASALELEQGSRLGVSRVSYLELTGITRAPSAWSIIVVVTTDGELWMIGGIWPISPGSTVYISGNGADTRLIATPVPQGIVKRLRFGADLAPGIGQTFTYTVFKNGIVTGCTFQVTGLNRKGGSDVEVTCNDQDELCIQVVTSAGAPQADHSGTLQFAPAA